jgi:AcrR family transcriptional regulator
MPRQIPEIATLRRTGILQSAQRLWSRQGYHGVSLRTIARTSGVTLALIDHHFGSKPQLMAAVVDSWQARCREVIQSLTALAASASTVKPLDVLRCIDPPTQTTQDDTWREALCMAYRHCTDTSPEVLEPMRKVFDPVFEAFRAAFLRVHPGASRELSSWAFMFMIGTIVNAAGSETLVRRLAKSEHPSPVPRAALESAVVGAWQAIFESRHEAVTH